MSVAPYGSGALSAQRSDQTFRSLKSDLATLQSQLSTGRKSETYAGLGAGASKSLSTRATLASLETYAGNVSDAQLRVKFASLGVEQIGKIAASLQSSLPGSYNQTPIGQTSVEASAEDGLRQVVDVLNSDVNGRYLFSGRTSTTAPVASYDLIVNGDATHAGLKQLVSERKAADLGADGLGRLAVSASGTNVGLAEEAAGLPFGLKITSASATGTGLTATTSAGPPVAATLGVAAQPAAGDTVSVKLALPDGTSTTITLTAAAAGTTPGANGFAIGADPTATAANLRTALEAAVTTTASTTLASASALKAATSFFAGSSSNPPERVAGPPFSTATATTPGTAGNTVIWYQGDDAAGSARETSPVRTGDGTSVAIGARANESGFQTTLAALGALVADTFSETDPTSQARYAASADRISTLVADQPVAGISSDLSVANVGLGAASDRLSAAKAQYEDIAAGVENADPSEVATKLLAAQTRLQASYQTTSTIAKLSLVSYL